MNKLKRVKIDIEQQFIDDTLGEFYVLEREDVDWLIEQADKVERYEKVLSRIAKEPKVGEGSESADLVANSLISMARIAIG